MKKNKLFYHIVKRIIDIIISICALIFVIPLTGIVWCFYRFGENKGPVFFKQERIGKDHKKFYIFKYRSMVVDADKKLKEDKELYELYVSNSYKLTPSMDPRITKFGAFLRKTSLDELPQFFNILGGSMSLIGPRPVVEDELKMYGNNVSEFLSVVPGAMGYWQASGRSNINYPERCDLELYYVKHASLKFDSVVFIKNIISIFKQDGAY